MAMRSLIGCGLLWSFCLVACSANPLQGPEGALNAPVAYRLDMIVAPDGVVAVAALDINNHGQVAGAAEGGPSGPDAFTWSAQGGFVTLARLATADFMSAFAINESGAVAGNAHWQDGNSRPVVWFDPGHAQDLGVLGRFVFESPKTSWSAEFAVANDINDRGHVVGATSSVAFAEVAYLWDAEQGMTPLGTLGGPTSRAYGVNAHDDVVGTSELADGTSHAFLWSRGTMTDLGALGGVYSEGYAINDAGEVTGIYQLPSGEGRVFRWTRSQGMVDAGANFPGPRDGQTSSSTGINAAGQIVGGVYPEPPGLEARAAVRQPTTGTWQELLPESPFQSFALAVNDRGVIVGHVATSLSNDDLATRAAVWTPIHGTVVGSP
jgi:probable HAF family extracellular repeat protein